VVCRTAPAQRCVSHGYEHVNQDKQQIRKEGKAIEWVKDRWRTADRDDRDRWLLGVPELLRRVDPNAPGIMFLTALADIISKEESPGAARFVRVKADR
jgi:hypothetical protein